jgi:hypothetical protein
LVSPGAAFSSVNPKAPGLAKRLSSALKDVEAGGGRPLVSRLIRKITKTGDQAILLSQLLYWFGASNGKVRARVAWKGKLWVAKTYHEWETELGIPARTVRECVKFLVTKGLIAKLTKKSSKQRTLHTRPVLAAIMKAIAEGEA